MANSNNGNSVYTGKMPNKSSAYISAPFKTDSGKQPTVTKGGDLRAKGSK